jgi:phage regulator Rha-like protein
MWDGLQGENMTEDSLIPAERIERAILLIRGHKVLLDRDLAELYGVPTKRLNEQVRRNLRRFPEDFMFQLTADEATALRSQFATLKHGRGQHRKYLPYAFTEQGVAMLSSILNSDRAIEVNIAIMRAFVRLRGILSTHKDLARKLADLERKLGEHDEKFQIVFEAIRQLMAPPATPPRRRIGFHQD